MDLGAFSISLTVKDLEASRSFYEKFGFEVIAEQEVLGVPNWFMLRPGRGRQGGEGR